MYKKTARILLAYVDDLNGIAKCGLDSIALNTFITTQIELKNFKRNTSSTYFLLGNYEPTCIVTIKMVTM